MKIEDVSLQKNLRPNTDVKGEIIRKKGLKKEAEEILKVELTDREAVLKDLQHSIPKISNLKMAEKLLEQVHRKILDNPDKAMLAHSSLVPQGILGFLE
ncbi:MAG: hypothetical protein QME40_08065 [bacterium]|nr:hypothetical protein [bacterium]